MENSSAGGFSGNLIAVLIAEIYFKTNEKNAIVKFISNKKRKWNTKNMKML